VDWFVALQGRRNNAIISRRRTAGGKGAVQQAESAARASQGMRANQDFHI
jgi:hypothetical protein